MRVVFAHSFPMIFDDNNNVYSEGGFSYNIWKRYLKHFDELTVIGRKKGNVPANQIKDLTISSGHQVSFTVVPNLSSIKGLLFNQNQASQIIRNELKKTDFLIARLPSEVGALAIKEAIRINIPYIVEFVGDPYDSLRLHGSWKGKLYAPISRYKTKELVSNSKFVIYVTKQYLQEKYPTKGNSIGNSDVEIGKVENEVLNRRINFINEISKRKLKLGMIGSLNSKYKGFDLAIKYLSKLKRNLPEFELHILGQGNPANFDELLQKYDMKSDVYFDGTLPNGAEVFQWLDNMDIYIHPSRTEGLPRALVEALSRACPSIGSRVGGIPELLDKEFIFDPNSFDEFSERLTKLINSKGVIETQAKINFQTAQKYTYNVLTKRRSEFIKKFIYENS